MIAPGPADGRTGRRPAERGTAGPVRALPAGGLKGSPGPLVEHHDVLLLDLDGVVYVGPDAVPGAAAALEKARGLGVRLAFVTNNASRTPTRVAAHLTRLGVRAEPGEVVTSAQAVGRVLAERLPPGAGVLVLGTDALAAEVRSRGFSVVAGAADRPAAVVQGYAADTSWRELAEATVAVHQGALWLAANADATLPSPRGPLPGNGALVNAVRMATGVDPLVCGKPEPALHRESVERTGARHPLVVGDRLDTDIEGAARVGCASLVVLTGVTTPLRLLSAEPTRRPHFVARDLEGLLVAHPQPVGSVADGWRCGGWQVDPTADPADPLTLRGEGADLDALRVLCAASWARADLPGRNDQRRDDGVAPRAVPVRPVGAAAGAAADTWSLPEG